MSTPYVSKLTPELEAKAKAELNEDPETRQHEINALRERVVRYPGLAARTDSAFLLRFLRARKFDQERAFQLLLSYYKLKKENEDMFAEISPNLVRGLLEDGVAEAIEGGGKNGETIFIFRAEDFGQELSELLLQSDQTQVAGIQFIEDLGGITWTHAKQISPSAAKLMTSMMQDAFPLRLKGIHYIHEPSFFDYVFALIKPFLKEKVTKRLQFHGEKLEGLHEFMNPEMLPEEYKGTKPASDPKTLADTLCACESEYAEDTKYGFVSMTVKDSSQKSSDAIENLPGTFKKLNVD